MPQLEIVADLNDHCGESPLWDADNQALYWIDIGNSAFHTYDWARGRVSTIRSSEPITGIALHASGEFVVVGTSGIALWNRRDEIRKIARESGGQPCRMNDCIADPEGRLFVGSCFYDPVNPYEPGRLLRVDLDGTVRALDEGFGIANGLGFSPTLDRMYFTDSAARCIYAYDYDRKTGDIRNRRTIVQVPATEGIPDGLTVDSEGFLWSAHWYGSRVVRYDPDGKIERQIVTPASQTSSVAFGGPDLNELFITTAGKLEITPLLPAGYNPNTQHIGGELYRVNLDIQGLPEHKTRLPFGA